MLKELQQWNVEAVSFSDVERRPWFIYHCYFQLLSRHHFQPEDLEEDAWPVEFLKRLPQTPLTADGEFDNEERLVETSAEALCTIREFARIHTRMS